MADFTGLAAAYAARNRGTLGQLNAAAAQPMQFSPEALGSIAERMRSAGLDEPTIESAFAKRQLDYSSVAPQGLAGIFGRSLYQSAVPGTLRAGAGLASMALGSQNTGIDDSLNSLATSAEGLVAQPEGAASLGEAWDDGDLLRYGARTVGGGIGSTAATIGTSAAGFALAGPPGALAGAGAASYVQNAGSMFNELRDRGVPEAEAAKASGIAGVPMAALDMAGLKFLPGVGKFFRAEMAGALEGGLAKRGAVGVGRGIVAETPTEAGQQGIQEFATSRVDPNYDIGQGAANILESAVAGGLVGGALGGPGGMLDAKPRAEPPVENATPDVAPAPTGFGPNGEVLGQAPEPMLSLPAPVDLAALRNTIETETDPRRRAALVEQYRAAAASPAAVAQVAEPAAQSPARPPNSLAEMFAQAQQAPTPQRVTSLLDMARENAVKPEQRVPTSGAIRMPNEREEMIALPPRQQSLALRMSGLRRAIDRETDPERKAALVDAWRGLQQVARAQPVEVEAPRRDMREAVVNATLPEIAQPDPAKPRQEPAEPTRAAGIVRTADGNEWVFDGGLRGKATSNDPRLGNFTSADEDVFVPRQEAERIRRTKDAVIVKQPNGSFALGRLGPNGPEVIDPTPIQTTTPAAGTVMIRGQAIGKASGNLAFRPGLMQPVTEARLDTLAPIITTQPEAPLAAPSTVSGFRTAQGSTYTVNGESTQRTKSLHKGHLTTDVGLKEPSDRTVYVSPEDSQRIGMHGSLSGRKTLFMRGDAIMLAGWNEKAGKWGVTADDRAAPIKFTTKPEVGKAPLELWGGKDEPLGRSHSKWHPGTPITEVTEAPLAAPEQQREAAEAPAETPTEAPAPASTAPGEGRAEEGMPPLHELDDATVEDFIGQISDYDMRTATRALGSEDRARRYLALVRRSNSTMDPQGADKAWKTLETEFGAEHDALDAELGQGPPVDAADLREIRAALSDVVGMDGGNLEEAADVAGWAVRQTTPADIKRQMAGEINEPNVAAQVIRLKGAFGAFAKAGVSESERGKLIIDAMERRGMSRGDAVELASEFIKPTEAKAKAAEPKRAQIAENVTTPKFRDAALTEREEPSERRTPAATRRWYVRAVMPDGSVQSRVVDATDQADAERAFGGEHKRIAAAVVPEPSKAEALHKELRDTLRRIAGSRVRLDARKRLVSPNGTPIAGQYLRGVVSVATDLGDAASTVRHEAIHFLRETGAIAAPAWKALEARAPEWRKAFNIDETYPDLDEAARNEEAVAEAYSRWAAGKLPRPGPIVGSVFQRIKAVLAAIKQAMQRMFGKEITAEQVFAAIEAGEMAPEVVANATEATDVVSRDSAEGETQDDPKYRAATLANGTRPDFIAPPDPGPLTALFNAVTTTNPLNADGRSWWRDTALPALTQRYVNKLDPLARLDVKRFGKIPDASLSTFKLAEMVSQDTGRFELLAQYGVPKWNAKDRVIEIDESVGGLVPRKGEPDSGVFNELKDEADYDKFSGFAYAKRAQRLLAEGRERLMSAAQIKASLAVPAEARERYERMLGRYQKWNEGLLDFLVDTGTIAKESRDAYASSMDYVPFYRVLESDGELLGPSDARRGLSNPDPRIKKLLGGTQKLGDLFENIARNARALTSAGGRNALMRDVHGVLTELGELDEGQGEGSVSWFDKGKKQYFRPHDPAMFMALAAQPPANMGRLYNLMKGAAGIFRAGITIQPSFMLANAIRGFAAGYIQTGNNLSLQHNTLTGFKNAIKGSASIRAMKAATGTGGYRFGDSGPVSGKSLRRAAGVDTAGLTSLPGRIMDALERVGEATELADRDAIYNNILAKGGTKAEAAYQAMNLLNYGRKGTSRSLQFMLPLVPFLNARIQGLYRMFEHHGDRSVLPGILARGALLTAATLGLWALHASDDDEWEKYQGEPLERRLNYHIIYAGNKTILIPKAFEFGALFGTLPEAIIEAMFTENGGKDLATIAAMTLFNTLAFNPTPQAIKPVIEVATNYDMFRDRPLESEAQKRLPSSQRAEGQTSAIARAIGGVTGSVGLSPIEVEHLMRGYLGTFGMTLLATGDTLAGAAGILPSKPTGVFGSVPVASTALETALGRFVKLDDLDGASRYIGDFYDLKTQADEIYNGVRSARANGEMEQAEALAADNEGLLKVRRSLTKTADALSGITRRMNRVRNDRSLSGSEMSEQLKPLIAQRDALARRATKLVEERAS